MLSAAHQELLQRIRLCEGGSIRQVLDREGKRVVFERDAEARLSQAEQIKMFAALGLDPHELEQLALELMPNDRSRPTSEALALLAAIAGCLSVSRAVRCKIEDFLLALLSRESVSLTVRTQVVRHLAGFGTINCDIARWVLKFFQKYGGNLNDAFAVQHFVEQQCSSLKGLPCFREFEEGVAAVPSVCTNYMLKLLRGCPDSDPDSEE